MSNTEGSQVDRKTQRNMVTILRTLRDAPGPLGAERIAEQLRGSGTDLSERAVRNYLSQADARGWTLNLGRRGRSLTSDGRVELDGALVMDKVGFVAARVDALAYRMTFDPSTRKGTVILNISTIALEDIRPAFAAMFNAYEANIGMGRLVAVARPGEMVGDFHAPPERLTIGTICSVSINGIFLQAKVATRSRFGGLLQVEDRQPKRFTQIINYDGTSLDPLEIFIRGHMTSVAQTASTGSGIIGASFREVPTAALPEVRRLAGLSERLGLGGVFAFGLPNQHLLDIPVAQGCAGLVVTGGLNPIAAIVENGITTTSAAMHTMCEFSELMEYGTLRERVASGKLAV
jgi:HTH-type transcriptional regulator, global nitrogen regulator NrpRI